MAATLSYSSLTVQGTAKAAPASDVVPLLVQRGTDSSPAANLATFTTHAGSTLLYIGPLGNIATSASSTAGAMLNLPHGAAPTSPANGDVWTTTAGMYVRVNGSTVGPLGTGGGGTPATTVTTLTGLQSPVVGTATNYAREDHSHGIAGLVDTSTTQSSIGGAKTFTSNLTVNTGSNAGDATIGRFWIGDAGGTPATYNGPTLAGIGFTADNTGAGRLWYHNGTTPNLTFVFGATNTAWNTLQTLAGMQGNNGFGGAQVFTVPASGAASVTPDTDVVPLTIQRGTDTTPAANLLNITTHAAASLLTVGPTGTLSLLPATDVVPLIIQRGTDSSPAANLLVVRNHANTANLIVVEPFGGMNFANTGGGTGPGTVQSESTVYDPFVGTLNANSASGPWLRLRKSRATVNGGFTVVAQNDLLGAVEFYGADGSAYQNGAGIEAYVDGATISSSSMPTRLELQTAPSGTVVPVTRLTINNAGTTTIAPSTNVNSLIVKRGTDSSPSADIQIWQSAAGSGLASVGWDGSAAFTNIYQRNLLRNGNFQIWQRGTAAISSGTGAYTYGPDGFYTLATGAAVTTAQSTSVPTLNNSGFSALITGAASNTKVQFGQRIEASDVFGFKGNVFVTVWILNTTGGTLAPTLSAYTPSATDNWATNTARLSAASLTLVSGSSATGNWGKWGWTGDVSSYTNIANGLSFEIDFGQAMTSGKTVNVAEFKVEWGIKATRCIPPPVAEEMVRCQRYYWQQTTTAAAQIGLGMGQNTTTTGGIAMIHLPVRMRAIPTLSVSNVAHFIVSNAAGTATATTNLVINSAYTATDVLAVTYTVASGLVAGNATAMGISNTSGRWIAAVAELV